MNRKVGLTCKSTSNDQKYCNCLGNTHCCTDDCSQRNYKPICILEREREHDYDGNIGKSRLVYCCKNHGLPDERDIRMLEDVTDGRLADPSYIPDEVCVHMSIVKRLTATECA